MFEDGIVRRIFIGNEFDKEGFHLPKRNTFVKIEIAVVRKKSALLMVQIKRRLLNHGIVIMT